MHIKNIIISGFRSYHDQMFEEDMSPRHNVIVGRNGSGKSNFFAAIQFVIGEKFADLRPNERQDLFHVGARRPGLSVFVEIVFDNSDGRLVIPGRSEEPEIRIRRTLGLKHDEYRVNDKKFSFAEVRQLLESAGFSAANPYYIVEQGQIVNLAHMREDERYHLIKDVAGTKVYESRRKESEAILADSNGKMSKIEESLGQLDERLSNLEQETSELKSFQVVDRKRKVLEHAIFTTELVQATAELQRIDQHLSSKAGAVHSHRQDQDSLLEESTKAEQEAASLAARMGELEVERKAVERERGNVAARRAVAALKASEVEMGRRRDSDEVDRLQQESHQLQAKLVKTKSELEAKTRALLDAEKASDRASKKLLESGHRLEQLQAKRGRKLNFKSKQQRDSWIADEIKANETVERRNRDDIARLSRELDALRRDVREKEADLNRIRSARPAAPVAASDAIRKELAASRESLNEKRRALWQQVAEREGHVRRAQDNVDRATHMYDKNVRLDIRQGWKSLQECVEEIGDASLRRAVHGQLIDLMSFDDRYAQAIETTAGNVLFNVVVDSFDASARLLEHMNRKRKPGRVTFFPLDTCNSTARDIPTTSDISPLLSHIRFDKKFKGVFAEVFGRTAVVANIDQAASVSSEHQCDVVTLDGDQVNRKGAITGGFTDSKFSRITAINELAKAEGRLKQEKDTLAAKFKEVAEVEQEITKVLQELETMASQDTAARSATEQHHQELRELEERVKRDHDQIAAIEAAKVKLDEQARTLSSLLDELKAEKNTDFSSTLSADEERDLDRLQSEISAVRAAADGSSSASVALSTECQLLSDTVHHVERRLAAVSDRMAVLRREPRAKVVDDDVKSFDADIKALDARLKSVDETIEAAAVQRQKLEGIAATARRKLVDASRQQQDEVDDVDRAQNQRALWASKRDEAQARIRRLGTITGTDVEQHASHSIPKLMAQLKSVNDEMKKYEHVNKKALDQYTALHEARSNLRDKKKELEAEKASISDLMRHLDQQKGEAIERTFKQVQFLFEKVFTELVPAAGASAELQLVKNTDRSSAEVYSGVRIRVGFGLGSTSELSQLSGGQKSLVALTLIFAIQRCDPAPFYLFDEIDAALDAEYRTSVARMIKRESESCQFVTATFKTELLEAADHVYGIFFQNKVSRVRRITTEDGAMLLRQAAMEERAAKRARDAE